MSLNLSRRQVRMLAEMGVPWPAPLARPASRVWVGVTQSEPAAADAHLLRNVLKAVASAFAARTASTSLSAAYDGGPPFRWALERFRKHEGEEVCLLLFGPRVATALLGATGQVGDIRRVGDCTFLVVETLAELAASVAGKPRLWAGICQIANGDPPSRDSL